MALSELTSDPISVFNVVAGILVLIGIILIRTDNQKGVVYRLGSNENL
jgi:hypothetical protein